MSHRLVILAEWIAEKNEPLNKNSKQTPDVFIVAAKRTPIGSYMGKLSNFSGPQLAGFCIRAALQSIYLDPKHVQQVILGNVLSAGIGQAPAKQAAILGGLDTSTICTTINKVCASGMKSIVFGAQSIQLQNSKTVLVGGFESMSNAPHLIMNARKGVGHGDKTLVDSVTNDGLTDPFKRISMGLCAQKTAKQMHITRQMQDQYCKMTYQRHIQSIKNNFYKNQIVGIQTSGKDNKKEVFSKDQQAQRYKQEVVCSLKPAFDKKQGTITSANASKINDGACCLILMSGDKMKQTNTKPLAKIVSYADAQIEAVDFCKSPYFSTLKALKKAGLDIKDIDYFQFNEAFSIVPIAMTQLLGIPKQKINVLGGAVAMGHPIGASGARIVQSLLSTLQIKNAKYGLAAICNGGGGSTAIIIQKV